MGAGRLPFLFLGVLVDDGLYLARLLGLPDVEFLQLCQQLYQWQPELLRVANTTQLWWKAAAAKILCRSDFNLLSESQAYYVDTDGSSKPFPSQLMRFIPQLKFPDLRRPTDFLPDAQHSLEIYQTSNPDIGFGLRTSRVRMGP